LDQKAQAQPPIGLGQSAAVATRHLLTAFAVTCMVIISLLIAPGWIGISGASLAAIVTAIAVIDYQSFRIPDWLNATGFVFALIHAAVQEPEAALAAIATACLRGMALALILLALRKAYKLWRGRDGLGLGDVKLAIVAGAWLDWLLIPIAIELATFAALTAYCLGHFVFGRPISATARLPFGTFLAPAIWICWILGQVMSGSF
jgi:leader peptidase (prepilin peptidase)/N-methyltransferase